MAFHYYYKRILKIFCQIIGTVIRINYNIESATGGKLLASLLITLNKPLVYQFSLDGRIQKVEYESLPKYVLLVENMAITRTCD